MTAGDEVVSCNHKKRKRRTRDEEGEDERDTCSDAAAREGGAQDATDNETEDVEEDLYDHQMGNGEDDGSYADMSNNGDSSDDDSSADDLAAFKQIAAESAKDLHAAYGATTSKSTTKTHHSNPQPSGSTTQPNQLRRPSSPTVVLPARSCLRKPSTGTPPKQKRAVTFSSPIVIEDAVGQGRKKRKKVSGTSAKVLVIRISYADKSAGVQSNSSCLTGDSELTSDAAPDEAQTSPARNRETATSTSSEAKKTSSRKPVNYTKSTSHHFGKPPAEEPPTEPAKFVPPAPPCMPSSSKSLLEELTLAQQASPKKTSKPRPAAGTVSSLTFPSIEAPCFGLIQEQLASSPFELLIAVYLLKKTAGRQAFPVLWDLLSAYPTPAEMAEADVQDILYIIQTLGLQNTRSRDISAMARQWCEDPPAPGRRHRKLHYPLQGCGLDIKPKEGAIDDETIDPRNGAYEVAHLRGVGEYGLDSWRIFCRDVLRGVARGYNGEGAPKRFEPEWKSVLPKDKELRACLRWMWLKEGWAWDAYTGNRVKASKELMSAARRGGIVWEPPEEPKDTEEDGGDADEDAKPASSKKCKSRTEHEEGADADSSPRKTIKLFGNQVLSFPTPPADTSTAPTIPSMFAAAASSKTSPSKPTPGRPSRTSLGKKPFGPYVNIPPTSPEEEASPNTRAFNAAYDASMPERYRAPDTRRHTRKAGEQQRTAEAGGAKQTAREGNIHAKSGQSMSWKSQVLDAARGTTAHERAAAPGPKSTTSHSSASRPQGSKSTTPKSTQTHPSQSTSAAASRGGEAVARVKKHADNRFDMRDSFDADAGTVSPDTGFDTADAEGSSTAGRVARADADVDAPGSRSGIRHLSKKEKVGTKEERKAARNATRKAKAERRERKRLLLESMEGEGQEGA